MELYLTFFVVSTGISSWSLKLNCMLPFLWIDVFGKRTILSWSGSVLFDLFCCLLQLILPPNCIGWARYVQSTPMLYPFFLFFLRMSWSFLAFPFFRFQLRYNMYRVSSVWPTNSLINSSFSLGEDQFLFLFGRRQSVLEAWVFWSSFSSRCHINCSLLYLAMS